MKLDIEKVWLELPEGVMTVVCEDRIFYNTFYYNEGEESEKEGK